ncbi:MAG: hypothetical protein MUF30_10800 [Burkholderiales bacterium]|nr:hypothetical protein [Burkholderiales bacterium]
MNSFPVSMKHAAAALLVLGGAALLPQAQAAGTAASTSIQNRATISYSVGGNAQTPIESSPTGNSTPGTNNGASTAFVVDNRVDLTVTEVAGAATVVNPGQLNAVATYLVTNTGNAPQAYQLTPTNITGGTLFGNTDNSDVGNLRVFVDANANGTYEPATDTATSITTLAADIGVRVFIVADVPVTATNAQFANVRLTAATAVNNTPATLLVQSTGADNPATVEIVFADGAGAGGDAVRNGRFAADDQYAVQSAALSVLKASTVISDTFNGTTNPKAIPGATVEYAVTVTNTGVVAASGLSIADPLPANTTFVQNGYSSGTRDVQLTVGSTNTFCIAEAGGTDTNADGCVRTAGGVLQVGAPALGAVAVGAANAVTLRFRVTIN